MGLADGGAGVDFFYPSLPSLKSLLSLLSLSGAGRYTENDSPQPQVLVALGFWKTKPFPCRPAR